MLNCGEILDGELKGGMQMNVFIIFLIVLLVIGLVIGFSLVETVVIVWIGSLLGLVVPFNTCFFIVLAWNLFFSCSPTSSSKN